MIITITNDNEDFSPTNLCKGIRIRGAENIYRLNQSQIEAKTLTMIDDDLCASLAKVITQLRGVNLSSPPRWVHHDHTPSNTCRYFRMKE
jgi:hypothetical protein